MAVVEKNNAAATEGKKVILQTKGSLTRSIGGGAALANAVQYEVKTIFFLRKLQKEQRNKNKNT